MSTAQHDDDTPDQDIPDLGAAVAQMATEHAAAAAAGLVQYSDDDHRAAWERYRAHPDTIAAQAVYTQRQQDLQPIRDMVEEMRELLQKVSDGYNGHMTNAHIAFQAAAHEPLFELTQALIALDGDGPPTTMHAVTTPG